MIFDTSSSSDRFIGLPAVTGPPRLGGVCVTGGVARVTFGAPLGRSIPPPTATAPSAPALILMPCRNSPARVVTAGFCTCRTSALTAPGVTYPPCAVLPSSGRLLEIGWRGLADDAGGRGGATCPLARSLAALLEDL
jgi:hypothetical protein